jgi:hypothetical protein
MADSSLEGIEQIEEITLNERSLIRDVSKITADGIRRALDHGLGADGPLHSLRSSSNKRVPTKLPLHHRNGGGLAVNVVADTDGRVSIVSPDPDRSGSLDNFADEIGIDDATDKEIDDAMNAWLEDALK